MGQDSCGDDVGGLVVPEPSSVQSETMREAGQVGISPYSGRDCIKLLRPSYTGLYSQMVPGRGRTAAAMM